MTKLLLASIAIRFFLFEWHALPSRWFRAGMSKVFWFAPNFWEGLSHCAYCNGFWVGSSLFGLIAIIDLNIEPEELIWIFPFGLLSGLTNYTFQLILNILEQQPVNKAVETVGVKEGEEKK